MTWRNTILIGDVRERLAELPDQSVQCVVTSPPYWGLRDYGTASWAGGDEGCDHVAIDRPRADSTGRDTINPGTRADQPSREYKQQYRDDCGKCGATRIDAQVGLEPTPEAYVCGMVEVFREVRRVLRDDGTLWLNMGDSYTSGGRDRYAAGNELGSTGIQAGSRHWDTSDGHHRPPMPAGLKSKDLVGIPWRVAFALQADGWWLRSDIIWSKPNPMPESVTDRPTKAHEYVFLLSKSATYHYDHEAIKEPLEQSSIDRISQATFGAQKGGFKDFANGVNPNRSARQTLEHFAEKHKYGQVERGHSNEAGGSRILSDIDAMDRMIEGGRNKRSVWEIATKPYAEAHFATYPPELVKPCILAGSREGDVVLDPFMGSGTTAMVALIAGRDFVGIELNPAYAAMAERRIEKYRRRLL